MEKGFQKKCEHFSNKHFL